MNRLGGDDPSFGRVRTVIQGDEIHTRTNFHIFLYRNVSSRHEAAKLVDERSCPDMQGFAKISIERRTDSRRVIYVYTQFPDYLSYLFWRMVRKVQFRCDVAGFLQCCCQSFKFWVVGGNRFSGIRPLQNIFHILFPKIC